MTILPLLRVTNALKVTCKQLQLLCRGQRSQNLTGFILVWPALRKKIVYSEAQYRGRPAGLTVRVMVYFLYLWLECGACFCSNTSLAAGDFQT